MYIRHLLILSCLLFFSACMHAQDNDGSNGYSEVKYPQGFTSQLDVVYTKGENWESKMDLYLPPKNGKPTPVVINIHGGGWNHGSKSSQTGFGSFFDMGFAVANIEYRMYPQAIAPAAVQDCRCALIYLIKNAKELNIDVNKIVVMGSSAGGHLALLTGLLGDDRRFDGNCPGVADVKVAAIIDKYGLADAKPAVKARSFINWVGKENVKDPKFVESVSPVSYITKNSPPVFIVHGDKDPLIPYGQSVDLHERLDKAGVINQLMIIPGGGHGGFPSDKKKEMSAAITGFLVKLGIAKVPAK